MLVPLSWLREYVDIPLPTNKLAERLTLPAWKRRASPASANGGKLTQ